MNQLGFETFDFKSPYTYVTYNYVYECLRFAKDIFQSTSMIMSSYVIGKKLMQKVFFHIGHKKQYRQINGLIMGNYDAQQRAITPWFQHVKGPYY